MITSLALIFISLIFGILLKKYNLVNIFNNLIIYIFLPSLIFAYIPGITLINFSETFILASGPWFLFVLSYAYFRVLKRQIVFDKLDFKTLVIVNGLGNTAFLGYPLVKILLGEKAMPSSIIIDQLGTFLILSSLATIYAANEQVKTNQLLSTSLKKLLTFPPFMSLILSLVLNQNEILLRWENNFKIMSLPLTPFAVMVLGMQINFNLQIFQKHLKLILASLFLKLILFPTLIYFIYQKMISGIEFQSMVLQSSMAPMFSSLIIIQKFQLKSELAAMIIFCGVIVSLLTVPLWSWLI
jgi:predicted permease